MGHMHIYGHVLRFSTQAFARAGTETPQGPRENWLRLVSRGSAKKVVCRRLKPMKLFIGNLPSETTPEDLLQIFDDFAPNHAHVVTTFGRPFGFGFVHIDEVVVKLAIHKFDGSDFRGRRLRVSIARRQKRRRNRGRAAGVMRLRLLGEMIERAQSHEGVTT
jgi:RNA recognition motif-containing protein